MEKHFYKYSFSLELDVAEVEATATLAVLATESLHGEARVQLEANYLFDGEARTLLINAAGEIGRDLNRLFLGFITREFGRDAFKVQRIPDDQVAATTSAA